MPIERSEVIGVFPTPFMFVTVDEETRKKALEEVLKEYLSLNELNNKNIR